MEADFAQFWDVPLPGWMDGVTPGVFKKKPPPFFWGVIPG